MSEKARAGKPALMGRFAWYNGEFIESKDLKLSAATNVAHYGSGVFEGIRYYPTDRGPAVFRLLDHMKRLAMSARYYELQLRWTPEELAGATVELIRREGTASGYIRPLVYYGEGPIQLRAKVGCPTDAFIVTRPLAAYLGEHAADKGIRVTVSKWRKVPFTSLPTTAKGCGQYANSVLAAHEALGRGFDEALLLNADGTVAEGSGENFFIVQRGVLITNDARSSILMGITRDTILTLARGMGLPIEIRPFTLLEAMEAEEAFMTGTAAEVQQLVQLDDRTYPIGAGTLGARLQAAYHEVVRGKRREHDAWLSYVS